MANEIASQQNIQKGEIILYQPDETVRIEVRMGGETVWLTQQQMAELFDKDRTVIGRHIRNIYKEEELERDITCAKFAHMGLDGDQQYEYTAYNLDVIISVGYRVKSKRGTKFRQWANKILKEYLLRGYAVNNRINALERQVAEQGSQLQVVKEKIDFFVRTSLPPVEGIFYDGQIFDAYRFVNEDVYGGGALADTNTAMWVCITDIARQKNAMDPNGVIANWMRNRNTIEYLGLWETLYNVNFNPLEFEGFRKEAGLNTFTLSPMRWDGIENKNKI